MSARPFRTRLGGICWMPRALRTRESTTTNLMKEVTMTAMKGARPSTPRVTARAGIWERLPAATMSGRLRRRNRNCAFRLSIRTRLQAQGQDADAGAAVDHQQCADTGGLPVHANAHPAFRIAGQGQDHAGLPGAHFAKGEKAFTHI